MAAMSEAGTRTINAYAAKAPGAPLEPYTFEAPPLPATGVEVKVTHCGLCGSDVHLWRADGDYKDFTGWAAGQKVQICGHEAVGEVTAVGSAVTHLKVGQRCGVGWQCGSCHSCEYCLRGDEQLCQAGNGVDCTCAGGNAGAFADYLRIKDAGFAFALPDALDAAATAPLLCGGQTVWTPLRQQTKAGDRVGVLGLGGLGTMAITFASKLGCEVTALSSSDSKKQAALDLGATKFVAHADEAQMAAAACSLDFILVTLATQQKVDFTKFFTLLRPRGTMCFVGMCPPISADVFTMGFTMHNITTSNTGGRKEMVEMLEFCARNKIGARVVERPLAKVNEVLAELESSKGAQRFVLTA